jgi:hypothetical protein
MPSQVFERLVFIAVVINNLEAAKRDEQVAEGRDTGSLTPRLTRIREELEAIESAMRRSQS